ncbi:cell surface protein, partial [Brachyspira catarrhinii]
NPYIRLEYKTALEGNQLGIKSSSYYGVAAASANRKGATYDYKAYQFKIMPVLGLGANSDIVSVWFEPSIGYQVSGNGWKNSGLSHSLAWGAYAELYLTPVKDLEWYFEVDVNNKNPNNVNETVYANNPKVNGASGVSFAASTG